MTILHKLLPAYEEGVDFEFKAAQGEHGNGEVPYSVWETYSAFANTNGGDILLGIGESAKGEIEILGIKNHRKVRKEFFDSVNNRQVISKNLLSDSDVTVIEADGKSVIRITVPRAQRSLKPIYIGTNPFGGTFRRNDEGDYRCDDETVRRMVAEAINNDRTSQLLENYDLDDLDDQTLLAYRNAFKSTSPNHPWIVLNDVELLRNLGGWGKDRQSKTEGLTVAGLLMFGKLPKILEANPNYVLDYQEQDVQPTAQRWKDRITTDGTWSGNLYDFYRKVLQKLFADLKVPFRMSSPGKRVDEGNVHEALREALVNTLIHADYSGRLPILIVKRPDMFSFRNPGDLRLPVKDVLAGGLSDCRNRNLQKMFQLVGAAEQAGSGFPKILRAWKEQQWSFPDLNETTNHDQTNLRLHMVSLVSQDILDELAQRFGNRFSELTDIERLALVIAHIDGKVSNDRLKRSTASHPSDLTAILRSLVERDFLEPDGIGRGTCYYLPGTPTLVDGLVENSLPSVTTDTPATIQHSVSTSQHLGTTSQHLSPTSGHLGSTSQHSADMSESSDTSQDIAARVRAQGRVPKSLMIKAILSVCQNKHISLRTISQMLKRETTSLQVHYISELVRNGQLELKYHDQPSHPNQAYKTRPDQLSLELKEPIQ